MTTIKTKTQALKLAFLGGATGIALIISPMRANARPGGPQPGQHPDAPRCLPPHVRAQLPVFDVNKNGRLDPEEHRAMREAERKADLATYDADGDGRLSRAEHRVMREGKMVERFEELDVNGDAEISQEEVVGSCTPLEHDFARVDRDSNGSITWDEFESAAPKGPRGPGPHDAHERAGAASCPGHR